MEKQIDLWLKKGVISAEQAEIMKTDVKQSKKLSSQNRFVIAISTIGAALLGIGAILFISANWAEMTPISKVIILSSSALLSYLLGYYLKYQKGNFPNVGASLLFLSALLVGASLFLVTQIYHFINANTHSLVLIWLLLLLPYVYTVRSYAVATLFTIVFYIWWAIFLYDTHFEFIDVHPKSTDKYLMLFFLQTVMLISLGTLHNVYPLISKVGRAMKWISLQISMVILFILSFDRYSGHYYHEPQSYLGTGFYMIMPLALIFAAIILSCLAWLYIRKENTRSYEFYSLIASTFLIVLNAYTFGYESLYSILFNILIFGICLGLIYSGYQREQIKLVNLGIFWICALIIVRYFDFFWDMLDTSIFFLLGGAILTVGAVFLERGRRKLKLKFNNSNIVDG